jgi:glycosyltransferase involved in cell wall biosynthesis
LSDKILLNFEKDSFRKEHNLEGKFVIIYVGAHGIANHLEQIIETGLLLLNTNVLFLLIGDGMEKKRLVALTKEKKLNNIRFLDPVPKAEVFKYILASDMGTSVLKNVDTFKTVYSNKTFDYMSCKIPILMAIDGVSKKLIEDAQAGEFVEPENPKDFAEKIKFYLNNPDQVIKQGENGYKFAKSNFDRIVLAEKYIGLIKERLNILNV